MFGFLGPNGAGKTTMIRPLLGFLKSSNGAAYIFGLNIPENSLLLNKDIGYVPGELNIYPRMTGEQFLNYFNGLQEYNAYLYNELMELFALPLNRKIKSYSRGMIQQLGIIQALLFAMLFFEKKDIYVP